MNQLEISFGSPLRIVVAQEELPQIFPKLTVWYERFKIIAKGDIMYNLPADMAVKMQVSYVDASNNPAKVDGPVQWASSDVSIATVTPDGSDSTIVTVTPVGPAGQVQVTAVADADLGAGVKNLTTVADITIVAGEAVAGSIEPVGAPIPKG